MSYSNYPLNNQSTFSRTGFSLDGHSNERQRVRRAYRGSVEELSPFLLAARSGDLAEMKRNWVQQEKEEALHVAAESGQLPIAQYLIERCGVPPNPSVLEIASNHNQEEIVGYLTTGPQECLTRQVIFEKFVQAHEPYLHGNEGISSETIEQNLQEITHQLYREYPYPRVKPLIETLEKDIHPSGDNRDSYSLLGIDPIISELQGKDLIIQSKFELYFIAILTNYQISEKTYRSIDQYKRDGNVGALQALARGEVKCQFAAEFGGSKRVKVLQQAIQLVAYEDLCNLAMTLNDRELLIHTFNEMPDGDQKEVLRPVVHSWLAPEAEEVKADERRVHFEIPEESNAEITSENTLSCWKRCILLCSNW